MSTLQTTITPFNSNIELLRDIAVTIGVQYLNNCNSGISFAITEYGRIQVMISDRRNINSSNNSVCVEYQGDGVMRIYLCDNYGYPVNDKYELFDTHSCIGQDSVKVFHDMIKKKFDIII